MAGNRVYHLPQAGVKDKKQLIDVEKLWDHARFFDKNNFHSIELS
jgi:hypothetical protein